MTITVGGASGGLTMPHYSTKNSGALQLKTALTTVVADNVAAFFTALELDHSSKGWETAVLSTVADTSEQTIVDVSGDGVLTHVVSPVLSGAGTVTVRVTAGTEVTTFVSENIDAVSRFLVGHFPQWGGSPTATSSTGLGGSRDEGYNIDPPSLMPTPTQTITGSKIGLVFRGGLKVTVQGSVNISAGSEFK